MTLFILTLGLTAIAMVLMAIGLFIGKRSLQRGCGAPFPGGNDCGCDNDERRRCIRMRRALRSGQ